MNLDLTKTLSNSIKCYLETNKHKSLSTIARAAGVGYTTVRRLAQGEAEPNQETALAIIDVILTSEEKLEFLNGFFPKLGNMLGQVQTKSSPRKYSFNEDLKYFTSLETHNFIFNLAGIGKTSSGLGTTREQIKRILGDRGIQALEEMLVTQVITEDSKTNRIYFEDENWGCLDLKETINQIMFSTKYYDHSMAGTGTSISAHNTGSVNIEAYKEINGLLQNLLAKVIELIDNPKSVGDIPVFVDFMLNVYDKDKLV